MRAGFWEILLIVILILVLFGHSKIPDVMKNLANGINIFKKELKGDEEGEKKDVKPAEKTAIVKKTAKKKAPTSAKATAGKPAKKPAAKKK
ncbi:MAG: twin-arginine translocase TatA/TatE family subunit [Alphaproteobacteria bacterium]|nr:twin-arginine translocase TatA/TatE family subunit [Alphaproteobacteria bacterium]